MFKGMLLLVIAAVFSLANTDAATINFEKLPFDLALKVVKGSGQRKLAYFTDPDCAYCQKLESELRKLDNVTLYMFLYPVSSVSEEIVHNIMCANDPTKAWDDWTKNRRLPPFRNCTTKTKKVLALGKKLHVGGTPMLIFSNGAMVPGYKPSSTLELMMFAASQ
jgi:thiol:disulfide interchange protein DsbC